MTGDLPEGDNPVPVFDKPDPVFKPTDRVRIREDFIDFLPRYQKKYAGKCGEVFSVDGHRIDIVMDRDNPRAQQTIIAFFTADGLEPAPPDTASWKSRKPEKVTRTRARNVACPRSVVNPDRSGS